MGIRRLGSRHITSSGPVLTTCNYMVGLVSMDFLSLISQGGRERYGPNALGGISSKMLYFRAFYICW